MTDKKVIFEKIESIIKSDEVVLFMKGNKGSPACGFSARILFVLEKLEIKFTAFDILSDEEVRSNIKEYSNWPTFPQLYIKGELIGGHDIIVEMIKNKEFFKLLEDNKIKYKEFN